MNVLCNIVLKVSSFPSKDIFASNLSPSTSKTSEKVLAFLIYHGISKKQSESRKKRFRQVISDYILDYVQNIQPNPKSVNGICLDKISSPTFDLETVPLPTQTNVSQLVSDDGLDVNLSEEIIDRTLYEDSNDVIKLLMKSDFYSSQIEHVEKFPAREAIYGDLNYPIKHDELYRVIRDTLNIKRFYSHQAKGFYTHFTLHV